MKWHGMKQMLRRTSIPNKLLDLWPEGFPDYENWDTIFHHPEWHPEGDHSLMAHIVTSMDEADMLLDDHEHGCDKIPDDELNCDYWFLIKDVVLFHDIGKAATVKVNDKGHNSFIMHERVGAEIFRENYAHLYPDDHAEVIEFCIREHMNWWNVKKQGKSATIARHRGFDLLCWLCWCDKIAVDKENDWYDRRRHFRHALDAWEAEMRRIAVFEK